MDKISYQKSFVKQGRLINDGAYDRFRACATARRGTFWADIVTS